MKHWIPLGLSCLALGIAGESVRVGPAPGGATVVPTRQFVRPAGESVEFGGRPVDLALSPDGRSIYVKDDRGVVVLDDATWRVRQELRLPQGGSMHGIAVAPDGLRVYVTSADDSLYELAVGAEGLSVARRIALPGPGGAGPSHACGIALTPDSEQLYVCLSRNNTLGVVDLATGALARQIPTGVAPWDVVLSPDGRTAYVSNWGGRRPAAGERTAPSSGTETLVDERGVASSGTVSALDLAMGAEKWQTETGLHASDLELDSARGRLFVANANSDTVSVLDAATGKVRETITPRPDRRLPFGSAPNGLALADGGRTLYVANGGNNAVAVVRLDERRSTVAGFIPAGWYPGAVAAREGRVYVANVKGLGSRRETGGARRHVKSYLATVSRLPAPDNGLLKTYTAQVRRDGRIPEILAAWERKGSGGRPVPVPERVGEPSVFEHVVYIIKENRTYDQVFGDLRQGNGDPALCVFGREITPNHHALAEQWVLLDNFYCNGVLSADGHSWATEGNVTDHLEKAFGGFTRSYTFGDDPLTYSSSGFLWDNALAKGLSFRNFGEMDYAETVPAGATFTQVYQNWIDRAARVRFTQNIGIDRLRRYSHPDYPGWNMRIPDVLRADVFLKELRAAERLGTWPNLTILFLPQDHTSGTTPGMPTPRAHLADNDLALGRVIEGLTRSRFWPKTCVFVIEDDPQDGFDHVDGHRSLCLMVSPYTRRGAVISDFYNQTSVLHTMQRILGLPPMNQMDAMAPLMRECFTATADLRPYTALPANVPLDELNPPRAVLRGPALRWANASLRQPFGKFDMADEDTLNRILWFAMKGERPYPAHLAGSHGRGLRRLGLRLGGASEGDD